MPGPWRAAYFDGETATRHDAVVTLDGLGLTIRIEADGREIFWLHRELKHAGGSEHRTDARLSHVDYPDARLIFDDPEVLKTLNDYAPHLYSARLRQWRHVGLVVGISTALIVAYFLLWPPLAGGVAAMIPDEWERSLGQSYLSGLQRFYSRCESEGGGQALDAMAARLAPGDEGTADFDVRVVSSSSVNAVALPGGHILIFDGLIEQAESPDEVAGVLAHEIGHVVKDHAMTAFVRDLGLSLIVGSVAGDVGYYAATLSSLSYSRDAEAEADRVATSLLAEADIDPRGFARFFERLDTEKEEGSVQDRLFNYLSTHPPLTERARQAREDHAGDGEYRPALDEEQWMALRQICRTGEDDAGDNGADDGASGGAGDGGSETKAEGNDETRDDRDG